VTTRDERMQQALRNAHAEIGLLHKRIEILNATLKAQAETIESLKRIEQTTKILHAQEIAQLGRTT
jgi:hypothetical protein